jgi:hypothetical protein
MTVYNEQNHYSVAENPSHRVRVAFCGPLYCSASELALDEILNSIWACKQFFYKNLISQIQNQ